MPKMKTHKGTAKRIKKTASGKLLRRRAFGGHLLAKKSQRRKRIIGSSAEVSGSSIKKSIKKVIGV